MPDAIVHLKSGHNPHSLITFLLSSKMFILPVNPFFYFVFYKIISINWQLWTHLELVKQFWHFGINFTRFIVFDLQFSANVSQISLPAELFPSLFKNKIAKVIFVGSFKWQCQCIFLWHCESWTGHLQKGFTGMPRHAYREPFTECLLSPVPGR